MSHANLCICAIYKYNKYKVLIAYAKVQFFILLVFLHVLLFLSNLITPDSLAYSAVHLMCGRKRASYNLKGSIAFYGAYIQSTSTDTIYGGLYNNKFIIKSTSM